MPKTWTFSHLNQAAPISSNTQIRDRVNRANSTDLYSFSLNERNSFRLGMRSSGQGATIQLLQDLNKNGLADANEVLQSTTLGSPKLHAKKFGNIDTTLEAGTYFLRVSAAGKGNTNYRLNLASMPLPADTAASPALTTSTSNPLQSIIDQVVTLTNDFRRQNGLPALTLNNKLSAAAQTHSQNMAVQDFFSHTGKDGSTPSNRISAAGYNWSTAAENIAAGYSTANDVVQGWINSPGHRANLLNANLKDIGVGYYYLANDTGSQNWNYYWTQDFGAPMQ